MSEQVRIPRPEIDREAVEAAARRRKTNVKNLPVLVLVALGLALLIKTFVVQAFYIPSGSMEQTLLINDRVLVNKVVYKFRPVHRGEVIVFANADGWPGEYNLPEPANALDRIRRKVVGALGLGQAGEKDYIKRVVGIPGDTVACCVDNHIVVNGKEVVEPYLDLDGPQGEQRSFPQVTVPEGKLFVLGDHRTQSSDSRDNGFVPMNKVVGRAFVVIWPPGNARPLTVPDVWDPKSGEAARRASPLAPAAIPSTLGLAAALPITVFWRRKWSRRRIRD